LSTPPPSYGTPPNPYQGQPQPNPYQGQQGQQPPSPYAGQPQQPGPYGPPQPTNQYPIAPQPARRRGAGLGRRLGIGIGALVLIGGGSYVYDHMTGAADTAKAGDCVQNKGTDSNPDVKVISCSDPQAAFKVLKTLDSDNMDDCNNVPGYVAAYSESGGNSSDLVLCLGKNTP